MKKLMSFTLIALFASTVLALASPDKAALEAKEKAAWQAFKDKKSDDFKKVVSAEMMGVYAEGVSDMAKEEADMQKWDMKSFAISDYKVVSGEADTAVTTYTVKLEGTYDGKDASGTYVAGSVWKKQHGEWKAIFHTNIKEAAPAK
ncbi:MAG: nuclear transport factor 2 family protein [Chthoniobacterales bacterium]|nr:nuclear transport factor 2 family protein [Chthoniobacterales bacterium]